MKHFHLITRLFLIFILCLNAISSFAQPATSCELLKKIGGLASAYGAEIPAYDPASKRVYVVAGPVIEYHMISNAGALSVGGTLSSGFSLDPGTVAIPNSVAVYNGILAASYAIVNITTNAQLPGRVSFYNSSTGAVLNSVVVGYLPDMIIFSADGKKLLTANEGEPNGYNQPTSFDPEGSVSIIDLSSGVLSATVTPVTFSSFNSRLNALRAASVRIYGPNATVAQDLEPEYIAISPDGSKAIVTLQENNALAVVDIASATVLEIKSLGLKNHNLPGSGLDASDRDLTSSTGRINIQAWPVLGMYQPDAIVPFKVGSETFYITANEGDARDWPGFAEEIRVGAAGYVLDPVVFPNAAVLKQNANLGRLQLTSATGNIDGDAEFEQIHALGGRSFSILNSNGQLIFDSGDQLEQITAAASPSLFNSDGTIATFDSRSDNKGPEPEGIAIGKINDITYAFIGLERVGDIMVFNVSDPLNPVFVQYINTNEDMGVEGLVFVSAANSPTGKPLLITTAEVSRTVSVFEVNVPAACPILVNPENNVYTGGVSTNIYLGYGPQKLYLNLSTSGGPYTYSWTGPGLSQLNISNPVFTATTAGSFTLTATITNASGCSNSCSITINVIDARVAGTNGKKFYLCHGNNTLEISIHSIAGHLLQHSSDRLGSCENAAPIFSKGFQGPEPWDLRVNNNPAHSYFEIYISGTESGPSTLRLIDIHGRAVLTQSFSGQNLKFGESLVPGTYFAELIQGKNRKKVKLVKL